MAAVPFAMDALPEVGSQPHHPASDFKYPQRSFGKAMRACQSSWFKLWPFLHYDEAKDVLFCHTCVVGLGQKKLKPSNVDPAFVGIF